MFLNDFYFCHKTNSLYEMNPEDHEKLTENITKTYQKTPEKLEKAINMEAKNTANTYKLAERIDHLPKTMFYNFKRSQREFL